MECLFIFSITLDVGFQCLQVKLNFGEQQGHGACAPTWINSLYSQPPEGTSKDSTCPEERAATVPDIGKTRLGTHGQAHTAQILVS